MRGSTQQLSASELREELLCNQTANLSCNGDCRVTTNKSDWSPWALVDHECLTRVVPDHIPSFLALIISSKFFLSSAYSHCPGDHRCPCT